MIVISETSAVKPETRTPHFYQYLENSGKSSSEIDEIRKTIQLMPNDTMTDYFIHDARNALGNFIMGFAIEINFTPDHFAQGRERLLKIREDLDWFIQPGNLNKDTIEAFLNDAENHEEWNKSVIENLYQKFCMLIQPPIES